jgi:hypothetical protein
MDPALVIILILIVLALIGFSMSRGVEKKAKKYHAIKHGVGRHEYGLPGVGNDAMANIYLTQNKAIIEAQKKTFEVKYDQLTAAAAMRKTDLIAKDKSVLARGVAGGLLLGPLGAVVGGMSGMGKKNPKGNYLILNYIPTGEQEAKPLILNMGNYNDAKELAAFLNKVIPQRATEIDGKIQL